MPNIVRALHAGSCHACLKIFNTGDNISISPFALGTGEIMDCPKHEGCETIPCQQGHDLPKPELVERNEAKEMPLASLSDYDAEQILSVTPTAEELPPPITMNEPTGNQNVFTMEEIAEKMAHLGARNTWKQNRDMRPLFEYVVELEQRIKWLETAIDAMNAAAPQMPLLADAVKLSPEAQAAYDAGEF